MRLTLRTLLAYLDDILEPEQAREIGRKVADSGYATDLINRIRQVLRKRRLMAPEVDATDTPGIEANTMAEYLDNTLPPQSVPQVEKKCLDDDLYLAECGACHQILTLVLGEPVEVAEQSRKRMYALGPASNDDDGTQRQSQQAAKPVGKRTQPAAGDIGDAETQLNPDRQWKNWLPLLLLALTGMGWLWLFAGDTSLYSQTESMTNVNRASPPEVAANPDPVVAEVHRVPDDSGAAGIVAEPVLAPPSVDPQRLNGGDRGPDTTIETAAADDRDVPNPRPAADDPNGNAPDASAANQSDVAATRTESDAVAIATGSPDMRPAAGDVVPPSIPQVPPAQARPIRANAAGGTLLKYLPTEHNWFVQPAESLLLPADRIAVPTPFQVTLNADAQSDLEIMIPGDTRLKYIGSDESGLTEFELRFGRIRLSTDAAARIGVRRGIRIRTPDGLTTVVELPGADSRVGIELIPATSTIFEQVPDPVATTGRIYVASGTATIRRDGMEATTVGASESVELRTLIVQPAASDLAERLTSTPTWVTDLPTTESNIASRYIGLFLRNFDEGDSVLNAAASLTRDEHPQVAELATRCLATAGQFEPLITTMSQTDYEEVRIAAIEGLRRWLVEAKTNGGILASELERSFNSVDAEIVYRLLWGFGRDDAHNPEVSQELVDWLDHQNVVVRELAFYHIRNLTGYTHDYRPTQSLTRRRSAVRKWQEHVAREGALLGS